MKADQASPYRIFFQAQKKHFAACTKAHTLFTTSAEGLWEIFLAHLPKEERQHYTCNACRRFVTRFGGLVVIDERGKTTPALWPDIVSPMFQTSVDMLRHLVAEAQVTGVFLSAETLWGQPTANGWTHLAVTNPNPLQLRGRLSTKQGLEVSRQKMAEKREDYGILDRSLTAFDSATCAEALRLLKSGQLYRGEKGVDAAKWLIGVHDSRKGKRGVAADNVIWRAVATAPLGFCNARSTVLGTLLSDIAEDKPFEDIQRAWKAKLDPARYQRAQVAPSEGNIAAAEKLFAELGLVASLQRRYVRDGDLDADVFVWQPKAEKKRAEGVRGLFGHLVAKKSKAKALKLPTTTITWAKFSRTVLPDALTIEAKIPSNPARFVALVTAADEEAPPILQWDREDARNPVSWYYHGGIDAEMRSRVLAAGGRYEDLDIRTTLIWNNYNDLDLHVITPKGKHIYYGDKRSPCGGWLDVDMNVSGDTDEPVENIRWRAGAAKDGLYQVFVRNYGFHRGCGASPFSVELAVGDEVHHFRGTSGRARATGEKSDIQAFKFHYRRGQPLSGDLGEEGQSRAAKDEVWGLQTGAWTQVTGILPSPNMWGEGMPRHGNHTLFLLDGCTDPSEGMGRGFFTETLLGELRPVRSTMEAHTASATIEGKEQARACGLGMSDQTPWNLTLRVKTRAGLETYTIDRWD